MAHYAFLNAENIVTEVIAGRDENDLPDGITSWEEYYGAFRQQVCKRTSYNTYRDDDGTPQHKTGGAPFRGQYAGIGDVYDADNDEFVTPTVEVDE